MSEVYLLKEIIEISKMKRSFNKTAKILLVQCRIVNDYTMGEINEENYNNLEYFYKKLLTK